MKLFYDLHMHSCLSPCGDTDMTPNNIVNMCAIKGLDLIAVTDHNHKGNVAPVHALATAMGMICLPGMEVQTREEVHALCYFPTLEALDAFAEALEGFRLKQMNRPEFFGEQLLMDIEDTCVGRYEWALITSMNIGLEALEALTFEYQGVLVPAHINKSRNSVLAHLGFMPPTLKARTIEVFLGAPFAEQDFKAYLKLYNSDAHALNLISEPHHSLEVEARSAEAVIKRLRGV